MASNNPFGNPLSSSLSSISSTSSEVPGPGFTSVLRREKRAVAVYLKEESSKGSNVKPLNDYLDHVLDPQKPIDDFENLDTCKWIISGGLTFEEFSKKVRDHDSSVMCGLVWTANFVAYRCRTCGISPCMSICSDCFQLGNHEGHDYNMFRSQAGGACDCGDANVMKPEGFCPHHGENRDNKSAPEAPSELITVAKEMMPRLFLRLLYHLREQFVSQLQMDCTAFTLNLSEMEQFLNLMQSLSDMGAVMRRVMAEALTNPAYYTKSTEPSPDKDNSTEVKNYQAFLQQLKNDCIPCPSNYDKYKNLPGMSQELNYTTIIEELVFWVLRYEFPQQLVTFLLGLLPDDIYKEAFAVAFVKHYSRISVVLMGARDRGMVANRVVHISVQLFSNRDLAVFLTENYNLLLIIILSLADMIMGIRVASSLEDPEMESNFHCVVNCEDEIMKEHCYWPAVSDLINVLSHRPIAHRFLENSTLLALWLDLLSDMQGMNLNTRELSQHVEFEPDTYYAAFSAELEISASPMWSLLLHCQTPDTRYFVSEMVFGATIALQDWYEAINFKDAMKPNPHQLTFHLPLHRYLATFIMSGVKHHDIDLDILVPQEKLMKKIMMHVLQIQVCLVQIYAGMWVRNGIQIKGQAMTYIQCHFCYSMADADLYLLQICACKLDPDFFVQTVLERFHILNWLSYAVEPSNGGIAMEPDHELAMVEGALGVFLALLGMHTYLGMSDADLIRKEMTSLLCMNDRQHSTLMDLMPEKTGVNGLAKELFEPTLKQLADYKAPNLESSGGLQQGTYMPKADVWENDFDPVHVSQRAIYRRDMQSAMDRYTEYLRNYKGYKKKSSPWPPFKINDKIHVAYRGIYKILNCKTMHAFLFTVLHKTLTRDKSLPDAIVYQSIHLLDMCLHFAPKTFPNRMPGMTLSVHDSQMDKWYGTSDIKANACDVINEVIVSSPMSDEDVLSGSSSVNDMDTSSLEEMFQIQPSTMSTSSGPITAAQMGQMPNLAMISLPTVAHDPGGMTENNFALGIPAPHPPTSGTPHHKPLGGGKRYESRGVTTTQFKSKRIVIKESLVSVLIKLYAKMGGTGGYRPKKLSESHASASTSSSSVPSSSSSSSSSPSHNSKTDSVGDGVYYIGRFLDRLYTASTNASRIIDETVASLTVTKVKAGPSDSEIDSKRRKAWNRQQRLMAEFASKQKAFMEQAMEQDDENSEASQEEPSHPKPEEEYDCAICSQSSPSTGTRPMGLVVFLQATSVMGHRHQNKQEFSLGSSESQSQRYRRTACGKVYKKKLDSLIKHFEEKSCMMAVNIGWEGGVVAQTCGHFLHLDCHKSYLDSLRTQNHTEVLAVNKREFWCPVCRQLSNSVIPMIPEESKTMLVKPVSLDPRQMAEDIAEMMVKRRIGTEHESLKKAMGVVMEDLSTITYQTYRSISTTPKTESVHLFLCSVARMNLELELLLGGGMTNPAQASNPIKKQCFLPLLHALSLHSKILMPADLYTELWAHVTGSRQSAESSRSVSLFKKEVPLLLKDPSSLLIQFILTLSFTISPEHLDFVIQMLYNLTYIQALTFISCKFSSDERDAWRRKGKQSQISTLDGMLSNIISWLSRSSLFDEIDNLHTLPAICQSVWSPQSVEQAIEEYCLPFLHIAALLKHHLFNKEMVHNQSQREFEMLASYLNLSSKGSHQSFAGESAAAATASASSSSLTSCVMWVVEEPHMLVRSWCLHLTDFINSTPQEAKSLLQLCPSWQKPCLIQLPKRYYQIFQMYRSTKCTNCNRTPKDPAICLVCGQFLCFKENCCFHESRVYESVAHSIQCGAGTGLYLLVNSSIIVVIRGPRATLWGSVYLDEHGEEDRDLKRGKPLFLSMSRYLHLESQWLSHSLDHSCKRWIWHRDAL